MIYNNQYYKNLISKLLTCFCILSFSGLAGFAQYTTVKGNDVTSPLHLLKPAYVTPYGEATPAGIKIVLDRVYHYLDSVTPAQLVDATSGALVSDLSKGNSNSIFMVSLTAKKKFTLRRVIGRRK